MKRFEIGDLVRYTFNNIQEGRAVITETETSTYRVHWVYFQKEGRVLTDQQLRTLGTVYWWVLSEVDIWSKLA